MTADIRERTTAELASLFPCGALRTDMPMRECTTLRLGGPADIFADISDLRQLAGVFRVCRQMALPVTVIGNGSNLLVTDAGIEGLVVRIGECFSKIYEPTPLQGDEYLITAQSGTTLQKLANHAARFGLTGAECLSGIPGTIGGAVTMNAGAYGGEISQILRQVIVMDTEGTIRILPAEKMNLSYRRSLITENPGRLTVCGAVFAMRRSDPEAIREKMAELSERRRQKQPLCFPSCGSTFKRPEGYYAGPLIEGCGLKGFRVGGASVSTMHAGFLLNDGEGTAADYLALIRLVREKVYAQTGVLLMPEVRIIGRGAPLLESL